MSIFEDEPGDYGDSADSGNDAPPAPWEYGGDGNTDSSGQGGSSGGGSGGSGDNGESDNEGSGGSSDYGDNPELFYSQNWNSGADYDPYPAQDYSSKMLGSNPELAYYGAYQPGSPYYGVPEFRAAADPYAMYTDAQLNENPELIHMPKPAVLPDGPQGPVAPPRRSGGGGGGGSSPRGPSIPPDALRAFLDLLRYGGIQRI